MRNYFLCLSLLGALNSGLVQADSQHTLESRLNEIDEKIISLLPEDSTILSYETVSQPSGVTSLVKYEKDGKTYQKAFNSKYEEVPLILPVDDTTWIGNRLKDVLAEGDDEQTVKVVIGIEDIVSVS